MENRPSDLKSGGALFLLWGAWIALLVISVLIKTLFLNYALVVGLALCLILSYILLFTKSQIRESIIGFIDTISTIEINDRDKSYNL